MKILVSGSAEWKDQDAIRRELSKFPVGTILVHGTSGGACLLADAVGRELGFQVRPYSPDEEGNPRNSEMIRREHPDKDGVPIGRILAFTPDLNRSRRVKDLVKRAGRAGIAVDEINA